MDDVARCAVIRVERAYKWRGFVGVMDQAISGTDGVHDGQLILVTCARVRREAFWLLVAQLRGKGVARRLAHLLLVLKCGVCVRILLDRSEERWYPARQARRVDHIGTVYCAGHGCSPCVHRETLPAATRPTKVTHIIHVVCTGASHAALDLLAVGSQDLAVRESRTDHSADEKALAIGIPTFLARASAPPYSPRARLHYEPHLLRRFG